MKIYLSHALHYDYQHLLYQPLKQSTLWKQHEIILPYVKNRGFYNTRFLIKNCECFVAEISSHSIEQGIELAWCHMFSIPMVILYREDIVNLDALRFFTKHVFPYKNIAYFIQQLEVLVSHDK